MENMSSNEYLYGRELFGNDRLVRKYYRKKKKSAKILLKKLLEKPLGARDNLRIAKVSSAIEWCQERIDEITDSIKMENVDKRKERG